MNNIAKHSGATEVWLRIHAAGGTLSIVLEDNGRGFAAAAANGAGEGLANMRRRMENIRGQFCCESRPGSGAIFRFSLPLPTATWAASGNSNGNGNGRSHLGV